MSAPIPSSQTWVSARTKHAFLWMHLANEPFIALYTLLLFILRKDLGATMLQLSIFTTLRPVISVFSFYWSANLVRRRSKLLSNLMGAWVIGRLPFLCLPIIDNVWFLIFASGLYQLFYRAGTPALMEILKMNMEKKKRESLVSWVYVYCFVESILFGLFVGKMLDADAHLWKTLFFFAAILSISTIVFQMRIPLNIDKENIAALPQTKNRLIQPLLDSIHLIRSRPDFARFQWGFMIGGIGLMLIAPALAIYYADVLSLTHENITVARYIFMGCGVVLSSFIWRKAIGSISIHKLSSYILIGFGLFPLFLLLSYYQLNLLYFSFLCYGIAQAGSHLVWHLSGTLFAKSHEDSSLFSTVNILAVGLRGAIFPMLGAFLCHLAGPFVVLILGMLICFFGSYFLLVKKPVYARIDINN